MRESHLVAVPRCSAGRRQPRQASARRGSEARKVNAEAGATSTEARPRQMREGPGGSEEVRDRSTRNLLVPLSRQCARRTHTHNAATHGWHGLHGTIDRSLYRGSAPQHTRRCCGVYHAAAASPSLYACHVPRSRGFHEHLNFVSPRPGRSAGVYSSDVPPINEAPRARARRSNTAQLAALFGWSYLQPNGLKLSSGSCQPLVDMHKG